MGAERPGRCCSILPGRPDAAAMARNFALVYTEMAFERASPTERGDAVHLPPVWPVTEEWGGGT